MSAQRPAALLPAQGQQHLSSYKTVRSQKSSNLTEQLQREREKVATGLDVVCKENPQRTPTKLRSISDVAPPPLLSSPKFLEASKGVAKDDTAIIAKAPLTPKRPSTISRGLSLQMPNSDLDSQQFPNFASRTPLSPKLDSINTYSATSSVLPRRSRGLDFSRACTNLHHSTLVDQSSPDSSPIMTGRAMMIPTRKSMSTMGNGMGSPSSTTNSLWSSLAGGERQGVASSVGSVAMIDSELSSSSDSDDDMLGHDEAEDPIVTTPQVYRLSSGISGFQPGQSQAVGASPGGDWMGHYSPAAASLMSFQRARLRKGRSRKSSSSASLSGGSSMASPTPGSPPIAKNVDQTTGHFAKELARSRAESRRSSLNFGTRELQISSGGESDDGITGRVTTSGTEGSTISQTGEIGSDQKHTVIQRPVSRRGNLMPKSKNFARIHAALMEEVAPVDTEVRREAEVVRQVRESDGNLEPNNHSMEVNPQETSPSFSPAAAGIQDSLADGTLDFAMVGQGSSNNRRSGSFGPDPSAKAGSKEFWNSFKRLETPPPPPLFAQTGMSTLSDDTSMDMPITPLTTSSRRPPSLQLNVESPSMLPTASELTQRINNKRRRDDDFDVFSFKRRAVSPSMSVQNSPVLQQAPAQKDGSWVAKSSRDIKQGNGAGLGGLERGSSGSSSTSVGTGPKRIGLQGMVDTHDAIMKMSIE